MDTLNHELVEIALDRSSGTSFEKFAQAFIAAVVGPGFVPLGGTKDGGADGFSENEIFASSTVGHFWQISKEENHKNKIRKTVERLKEFGREPRQLTYLTSRIVQHIDVDEDALSDELGIRIRIRDQRHIVSRINDSVQTVQAFNSYLLPHLAFLQKIGGATTIKEVPSLPARTLSVFLGQEIERRSGKTELLESVTDSLILWSLEGTDPDKNLFLTRSEILSKIETALPSAKHFVRGVLDHRLETLSTAANKSGREIRWHRKEDKFCLPHETRKLVLAENLEDESLKVAVSEVFRMRASQSEAPKGGSNFVATVVDLCHRTLQITFEKQGLELAYFVLDEESEDHVQSSIAENVDAAIEELGAGATDAAALKGAILNVLRKTFYDSTEKERLFLSKLSRTYTLLLILKNEPKIVEYFRGMSANLLLYVGADLIVRALSEHYLEREDKMTANMFDILRGAGSELILTERTLDEVWSHLKRDNLEFQNVYAFVEPDMTIDLARHIDRILIRSYFYARLDPDAGHERPKGWRSFVGQFCTYDKLHVPQGKESLRNYLCERFGFVYEEDAIMWQGLKPEDVEQLTDKIVELRAKPGRQKDKARLLAENDALHVFRVYQRRRQLSENAKSNPYGYRTWWLTQESVVLRATNHLVVRNGARYMMRPEFLLNFIALAPSAEEVRKSYATIFPTLLGVKLSNRVKPEILKDVMGKVKAAYAVDEARARATVREYSDQLKADQFKIYERKFERPKS